MKTNVTEKLMQEHQLILQYIAALEATVRTLEASPDREDLFTGLLDYVDFVRSYADKYHHAKEEDILFKYLEEPGVLTHCNPLPVMNYEHDEGRTYIRNLEAAVHQGNKKEAIYNALSWAGLLKDHIAKEDQVLYVMAEEGLGPEARARIIAEYAQAEKSHLGETLEKNYQEKLLELKAPLPRGREPQLV